MVIYRWLVVWCVVEHGIAPVAGDMVGKKVESMTNERPPIGDRQLATLVDCGCCVDRVGRAASSPTVTVSLVSLAVDF